MLIAIAAFVGLLVGALLAHATSNRLRGQYLADVRVAEADRDAAVAALAQAHISHTREMEQVRSSATEKVDLLQRTHTQLDETLQVATGKALREATQQLTQLAEAQRLAERGAGEKELAKRTKEIEQVVAPIAASLQRVESQITQLDQDRKKVQGQTGQLFEQMRTQVEQLRGETGQLVTALRKPQVRGSWGEMQLRNCVEAANMTNHVDFVEQHTVQTGTGMLRPDMIVRMAGGSSVIVDSKVPLEAYLDALKLEDGPECDALLLKHAANLRRHLDQLGAKAYQDQVAESPEFVVCFVPNDVIFGAAMTADPTLLEYGASLRVLLATPATLMALLYAVAYGWRQERIADEARELAALAQELHKRAGAFLAPLQSLGTQLNRTVESYNKAVGSIESRFLPQLRRMEETGALGGAALTAPAQLDTQPRAMAAIEAPVESDAA